MEPSSGSHHDVRENVKNYFDETGKNAICSAEAFQGLSSSEWIMLREICQDLSIDMEVIFYVRDWLPFALSSYDQGIKRHGEYRAFDDVAPKINWPHYHALKNLSSVFELEQLHVFSYDDIKENVALHFLQYVGCDIATDDVAKLAEKFQHINRSLTLFERNILREINQKVGPGCCKKISDNLVEIFPYLMHEPDNVNADFEIIKQHKEEAAWINVTFFGNSEIVSAGSFEILENKKKNEEIPSVEILEVILSFFINQASAGFDQNAILKRLLLYVRADNRYEHLDALPADFDPIRYMILNPDIIHAGVDPFHHFMAHGKSEGRKYKID